ncbi:hypothetical protein [Microbacterium telephonicum]|uniref:Uncharacterized protein n=1 Tax=Microbacterium telephonicum TaxID=1714841 RepID=A0A498BUV5_9MICO|nr:hypothetical protein [Microbacterium telephonicum]RLK47614.1 hypothetical protein C7474_2206 [Microbacterium telephonicum]
MIVTLTPRTDFFPVPRVEIGFDPFTAFSGGTAPATGPDTLSGGSAGGTGPTIYSGGSAATASVDLPAGTDSVTLWWRSEGRTGKVRGVVSRFFTGAGGFLDLEAGLNALTTYELECFDGDTSLGRVSLGTVSLPWDGDENAVVIQQPLNPNLNAQVINLEGAWPSYSRTAVGELVTVEGATRPVVVGAGPRQGLTNVDIDFGVTDAAESAAVWATLGTDDAPQVPVWLIRAPAGFIPRRLFAHIATLNEVDIDYRYGDEWSRFQATVTEVSPPAPGLVISPLSYDDLDVSYASYDARDDAYPSYDDQDTDWALAGAAGGA